MPGFFASGLYETGFGLVLDFEGPLRPTSGAIRERTPVLFVHDHTGTIGRAQPHGVFARFSFEWKRPAHPGKWWIQ